MLLLGIFIIVLFILIIMVFMVFGIIVVYKKCYCFLCFKDFDGYYVVVYIIDDYQDEFCVLIFDEKIFVKEVEIYV